MAPTMTRGFLSQPALLKTDPGKGKGGVTVNPDVRVDLVHENKLPLLESWHTVANSLPVGSTSTVGDNSGGERGYNGVDILGGRPIPTEPDPDTVTGLHSPNASTIVATSTQTTTITRRVIITTRKSAAKLGTETSTRSEALAGGQEGVSKGVQKGRTEAGVLSGSSAEETTPLSYFLPQGGALPDNRSSRRIATATDNNKNNNSNNNNKEINSDSFGAAGDDEANRILQTSQTNPRNINEVNEVKSSRLQIEEKKEEERRIKSSVGSNEEAPDSNEGAPDEKVDSTSGTSSSAEVTKTSTGPASATTTSATKFHDKATTTTSSQSSLQEKINLRLSNDQSNAIEETFNEIETERGSKSKLGFIADNYLALRQKHKARSTTTRPTTSTSTTTTTATSTVASTTKSTAASICSDKLL